MTPPPPVADEGDWGSAPQHRSYRTAEVGLRLRVVFMGSPAFAVPSLLALHQAGHDLPLVVTSPPRKAGRGQRQTQPPVATAATELGIAIYQPERIGSPDALERIAAAAPDAIVVAAYGQILPPGALAIPPLGCLNVHPSLLPRHRGASPISAAILAGDAETGVSIMLMDEHVDTGPVLGGALAPIQDADDELTLSPRLATLGAQLLVDTLPGWAAGTVQPQPQDPSRATLTRPTTRADGILHWDHPARDLWRRVRAYAAWPGGLTWWRGRLLRIQAATHDPTVEGEPGLVQPWGQRRATAAAIGTGKGVLLPTVVALESRRPMAIDAFLRGYPRFLGSRLESSGPAPLPSPEPPTDPS